LNKQSGWKAMTGISDFSKLATPDAEGPYRLAFDIFVDRIVGFVGNYFVKLGGKVDALVFSGGIGEGSAYLRAQVVKRLECLGFQSSPEDKVEGASEDLWEIGRGERKILVCKTDEEAEMARSVFATL
jgi:acetate kinase